MVNVRYNGAARAYESKRAERGRAVVVNFLGSLSLKKSQLICAKPLLTSLRPRGTYVAH